jgi:hypothetical protein
MCGSVFLVLIPGFICRFAKSSPSLGWGSHKRDANIGQEEEDTRPRSEPQLFRDVDFRKDGAQPPQVQPPQVVNLSYQKLENPKGQPSEFWEQIALHETIQL